MQPIKILIVDDSVVMRGMLSEAISMNEYTQVVAVAANGKIALDKLEIFKPDAITLDIEMPEMNGLETLKHIRLKYPNLPVIIFSSLTQRGATVTIDALAAGATDYVNKPTNVANATEGVALLNKDLIPKIHAACKKMLPSTATRELVADRTTAVRPAATMPLPRRTGLSTLPPKVLVIGSSTGGPNALVDMFKTFPQNYPLPILVVQHMPEFFTEMFAKRLNESTPINFCEAKAGDIIKPGHGYLAPGGKHMEMAKSSSGEMQVVLHTGPQENSCRPAVDVLFRNAVSIYQDRILSVVLTGMGQDGRKGAHNIRDAGGSIIVQDEATSVVWGMPGYIAQDGIADAVLPLNQITAEIMKRTQLLKTV